MNFFERRKILKRINSLDLTPVKLMESERLENGKTDILLPRFTSIYLKRALQSKNKAEVIRIHLDETGSAIWSEIDGKKNMNEIASAVQSLLPEKLNPPEETPARVSRFLSLLYQERYITFLEISGDKKSSAGK